MNNHLLEIESNHEISQSDLLTMYMYTNFESAVQSADFTILLPPIITLSWKEGVGDEGAGGGEYLLSIRKVTCHEAIKEVHKNYWSSVCVYTVL